MTTPAIPPSPLSSSFIPALPDAFHYIPNFITADEEAHILQKIRERPYVHLSRRKLQVYPAQLTAKNVLVSSKSLPQWLVDPVVPRFEELGVFNAPPSGSGDGLWEGHGAPNHVLVNEYEPGEGIMPHEDGCAYVPIVATVSLGAPIVLDIYEKDEGGQRHERARWRILQEERSLLVTRSGAYQGLLHGISEVEVDEHLQRDRDGVQKRSGIVNWDLLGDIAPFEGGSLNRKTRVSLTYRDVLKVSKLPGKLLGARK